MATFNGTLNHSSLDADENSLGTVDTTTTSMNANNTGDMIGIVFPSVTIAKNSTISAATITVTLTSGTFDNPDLTISGFDEDNTNAFNASPSDISIRATTTATATWFATNLGVGAEVSPDLSSIVQEIVDRAGWSSGNQMGFKFLANSNTSDFRIRSYDNGADYAVLDVTYTAPSGAGQPAAARARQVPGMRRPHFAQGW